MAIDAKSSGWTDQQKWMFGLLGSVVTGLLLWYLTHEGGPLNSKPTPTPTPTAPVLTITAFELPFPLTGRENHVAQFTIRNDGFEAARGCILVGDVSPALGQQFSVDPHASFKVSWGVRTFDRRGEITLAASVRCSNASSSLVTRTGSILFS